MGDKTRGTYTNLLPCFFSECEAQLNFLVKDHGYNLISGLAEYVDGHKIIHPYKGVVPAHLSRAVARLEKQDIAFEINFESASLMLDCYFYYPHSQRIAMDYMIKATKKWTLRDLLAQPVTDEKTLTRNFKYIRRLLKSRKSWLIDPNPKIYDRARTIQQKMTEHLIREKFLRDMEKACIYAARAFMDKNYKKVVELLSPYEQQLNNADLRKLVRARKNLAP